MDRVKFLWNSFHTLSPGYQKYIEFPYKRLSWILPRGLLFEAIQSGNERIFWMNIPTAFHHLIWNARLLIAFPVILVVYAYYNFNPEKSHKVQRIQENRIRNA